MRDDCISSRRVNAQAVNSNAQFLCRSREGDDVVQTTR